MTRPTPTEMSMSDAFFKKMAEIVEANLGNEQFGVEDLVREIGLSRSQVHRKLHEATGQSISQFIREIRLQRAHELLVDGAGTASEIAFSVGFGSPTYFNKCFVEHFGYTPGEAKDKASSTSVISNRKNLFQPGKGRLLIIGTLALVVVAIIWFINENIGRADVSVSGTKDIKKDAIAVLYFDNISGDPSQDYLSDGVTDRDHFTPFDDQESANSRHLFCKAIQNKVYSLERNCKPIKRRYYSRGQR